MSTYNQLQGEMDNVLRSYGQPVLIRYYNYSGARTGYDDNKSLTQSGNDTWAQGFVQNLQKQTSSSDQVLVEQGKILYDDSRIYFNGSITTNGSLSMKIGLGSPNINLWYTILPMGDQSVTVQGQTVYHKYFARILTNGSLAGEGQP